MSENSKPHLPTAAPETHRVVLGPSFMGGEPGAEEWLTFTDHIQDPTSLIITELWADKSRTAGGVPLRKDFEFQDLAKYGSHMTLVKLTDEGRWLTTFAGDAVVDVVGFEPTGKHLDDFGTAETLEFWQQNLTYITDEGRPFIEFFNLDFVDKNHVQCVAVNLPLRSGERDFPDAFLEAIGFGPKKDSGNTPR